MSQLLPGGWLLFVVSIKVSINARRVILELYCKYVIVYEIKFMCTLI